MPAHHYSLAFQPCRSHGNLKTTVCSTPTPRLLPASHLRAPAPGSRASPTLDQHFLPLPHGLHILSGLTPVLYHTLISPRSLPPHHLRARKCPVSIPSVFTFLSSFLVLRYFGS